LNQKLCASERFYRDQRPANNNLLSDGSFTWHTNGSDKQVDTLRGHLT